MNEKYIQILSIGLVVSGLIVITWLYWAAPKDLAAAGAKASETFQTVTNRTQVMIGTYEVDQKLFAEGLDAFRSDRFVLARDLFDRADPEKRDARTQFYISYSFYRQGWGRFSNDDELFGQGLAAADRVVLLDRNFKSDDAALEIKTPVELKLELEEGMRITSSDFNPLRVLRQRK